MGLHEAIETAILRTDSEYLRSRWECPEILWNLLRNFGQGDPDLGLDRLLELLKEEWFGPKEFSYLTRRTGVATRLINLEEWSWPEDD